MRETRRDGVWRSRSWKGQKLGLRLCWVVISITTPSKSYTETITDLKCGQSPVPLQLQFFSPPLLLGSPSLTCICVQNEQQTVKESSRKSLFFHSDASQFVTHQFLRNWWFSRANWNSLARWFKAVLGMLAWFSLTCCRDSLWYIPWQTGCLWVWHLTFMYPSV